MSTTTIDAEITRARPRRRSKPMLRISHLEEPELVFGNGQRDIDPKLGMLDNGPYSVSEARRHPSHVRLGLIGSGETIAKAKDWLTRCASPITPVSRGGRQHTPFPGFSSEEGSFKSEFVVDPACERQITSLELKHVSEIVDRRSAFEEGLKCLVQKIQMIAHDHRPDVILVALPKEMYDACRSVGGKGDSGRALLTPAERTLSKLAARQRRSSQGLLFDDLYKIDTDETLVYRSFRRALKAKAMRTSIPIQILRPRTYFDESECPTIKEKIEALRRQGVQEPATRAWNFCTAMYFKANGEPWRLANVPDGTCYAGIAFFRHDTVTSPHLHTSVAQLFTDQGDALVVRGDRFEWDEHRGSPHVTHDYAQRLVAKIAGVYQQHVGFFPRRLVIHKSSRFTEEERRGFIDGIQGEQIGQYDLVALYPRGIRLFREGKYPPIRGTLVEIGDGGAILYTMGYIPTLDTCPKGHVPRPIEIIERFGDSDLKTVCRDILGLTKLNWNSADHAGADPITLRFSRMVGEVLTELKEGEEQPHYRFYV